MNAQARVPWLTIALVASNLVLAVFVTFGNGLLVQQFGFRATSPRLDQALVSMFLHWNLLHLLGNMLFLTVAGSAVEREVGAIKFGAVYLLGGIAGLALHWAVYRQVPGAGPLVGASACVAACLGLAAVRFALVRVPLAPGLSAPLWTAVLLWVGLQAAGMFVRLGDASGGTAFAAHLGGLAVGLLMSVALRLPSAADHQQDLQTVEAMQDRSPAAALSAARQALQQRPNDPQLLARALQATIDLGDRDAELQYAMQLWPHDARLAGPSLERLAAWSKIPALERMKRAASLPDELRIQLLRSVAREPSEERPQALLELAQTEPSGPWASELAREFPLHPATQIARNKGLIA